MKVIDEIPVFGLCDWCQNRPRCKTPTRHMTKCDNAITKFGFKEDPQRKLACIADIRDATENFKKSFKKVDPRQIKFVRLNEVVFHPLGREMRLSNSRGGHVEPIDDVSMRKWCEQCGAEFTTVNRERHLCDECSEEIVTRLGCAYMQYYQRDFVCEELTTSDKLARANQRKRARYLVSR